MIGTIKPSISSTSQENANQTPQPSCSDSSSNNKVAQTVPAVAAADKKPKQATSTSATSTLTAATSTASTATSSATTAAAVIRKVSLILCGVRVCARSSE